MQSGGREASHDCGQGERNSRSRHPRCRVLRVTEYDVSSDLLKDGDELRNERKRDIAIDTLLLPLLV